MVGEQPVQLSVIVPVFNEVGTLPRILVAVARALPGVSKEVIVVDDGSTDGTREWIRANVPDGLRVGSALRLDSHGDLACDDLACDGAGDQAGLTIRSCFHAGNKGKGAGLRTGLAAARGEVIVIQDGDLEYDPSDWAAMYEMIAERNIADVVYGSRFQGQVGRFPYRRQYFGNMLLSRIFSLLYRQRLTDVEVCYKMFTKAVARGLHLTCDDFGCEIQMAAQMVRPRCWRIQEVGIRYQGRTYREGKGIGWRDGLKALWYLLWYRVAPWAHRP